MRWEDEREGREGEGRKEVNVREGERRRKGRRWEQR